MLRAVILIFVVFLVPFALALGGHWIDPAGDVETDLGGLELLSGQLVCRDDRVDIVSIDIASAADSVRFVATFADLDAMPECVVADAQRVPMSGSPTLHYDFEADNGEWARIEPWPPGGYVLDFDMGGAVGEVMVPIVREGDSLVVTAPRVVDAYDLEWQPITVDLTALPWPPGRIAARVVDHPSDAIRAPNVYHLDRATLGVPGFGEV